MPSILVLGLDPVFADYTQLPGLTPELVRAFINSQLERQRSFGYDVEDCLVDFGDTAEAVTAQRLRERKYDCVMIGADCRTRRNCCCSKSSSI